MYRMHRSIVRLWEGPLGRIRQRRRLCMIGHGGTLGRWIGRDWICWQRTSFYGFRLSWSSNGVASSFFTRNGCRRSLNLWRFFLFRSGIIVRELNADLSSISSLAIETVPQIVLTSSRHNDFVQRHPCFSNEIRLLIVVEYRYLELVVIRGVMDSKP